MNMDHLYVKTSKINGKGLHTSKKIRAGEVVGVVHGDIEIVKKWTTALSNKSLNWIGIGRYSWINTNKSPFRFINHSCGPNTYIKGKRMVIALRDIPADSEEITMDYSFTECDKGWSIESCGCGSRECRKNIGPVTSLSLSYFKKKISLIPENFRKIFLIDYKKVNNIAK